MALDLSDTAYYEITCDACSDSREGTLNELKKAGWKKHDAGGSSWTQHFCPDCEPNVLKELDE